MKQSSRIKLLAFLFLLSGLGAALVLLRNSGYTGNADTSFKIGIDSASLDKITLTLKDDSRGSTTLAKKGQKWLVNSKYKAKPNFIELMIVGLSKAEVKRPVAEENKKKVIDILKKKGIRVKIEGKGWNKEFLICTNENDANSSYYIEEGSVEPYIVYVPGFSGDMTNLFRMREEEWRSRELFVSTPMSLQKITVSYPAYKGSGVDIKWNADKTFTVAGVTKVDSSKVITYLSQYEYVNVENFIYKDKDNILAALRKTTPQAIIEVSDLNPASTHKLSIYNESKDPKGILAIVEPENELVTMKPETLFRILVRKEFFEKK